MNETNKPESTNQFGFDVKIKKLVAEAVIPSYAHPGDAGLDVTAISVEYDSKNDCFMYHTGLAFEVPKGYVMLIFPRSSNRKTMPGLFSNTFFQAPYPKTLCFSCQNKR